MIYFVSNNNIYKLYPKKKIEAFTFRTLSPAQGKKKSFGEIILDRPLGEKKWSNWFPDVKSRDTYDGNSRK